MSSSLPPRPSVVDSSRFPLVILQLPSTIDAATIEQLTREQAKVFERGRQFVSIVDLRRVSSVPNATVRQRLGDYTRSIEAPSQRYQLANAIVIDNPLIRAALSAIHWIAPPPVPTQVVATREAGLDFLRKHLDRAGIPSNLISL